VNIVDFVLIGAVVVFAVIGWYRGFIVGLLSFGGFLVGGLVAALILPRFLDTTDQSALARAVVMIIGVLAAAFAAQFAASLLGDRLRDAIPWRPARTVDHAGGALLNVLVLAMITWIVISIAGFLPTTAVTRQMADSKVATVLNAMVPPQVRGAFDGLQGLLSSTEVPSLLSGLSGLSGPDVDPPDGAAVTHEVEVAGESVMRVVGNSVECNDQVSGSGFVVAPGKVVTNAHVVAGVQNLRVHTVRGDARLKATVVYFDPSADIALLDVPGLTLPPIPLATEQGTTGDSAAIAGFPHSGPFTVAPVRIRTLVNARSDDIYGNGGVMRNIYIVRGSVQRGDSGGPLLRPDGKVLGMVFGADQDQKSNGYAISSGDLALALAQASGKVDPVPTGSCRIKE
jgi:S1-C subfamily serine protease